MTRRGRDYRAPIPLAFRLVAGLAAAFVLLPVLAVALRVDWPHWLAILASPSALAALRLSAVTATASTVVCLALGVPLGLVLARGPVALTRVLRPLVLLPLVMPPVVSGLALLAAFGRRGLVGTHLATPIAFTTAAVVLAEAFVSLPFLVISVDGALGAVEPGYERAAATLGAGPLRVLTRVTLPLATPGILSGAVLAFARSLGEFGATITFAGSLQGVTRTLPLEIYLQRETDPAGAVALSMLLVALSAAVVVTVHGGLLAAWFRRRGVAA